MASAAPLPQSPGFLSRIGGVLSGVARKVEGLPGYKWASGKVQDVVTSQDAIHGWQDIYKGWTTKDGVPIKIQQLKVGQITSSPKAAVSAARAARGASAARTAASDVRSAGNAARAARGAGAARAAGVATRDAQTVARGASGDARALASGSVDVRASQTAIAGGFKETTTVDVTERQFIPEAGGKGLAGAVRAARGARGAAGDLAGAASRGAGAAAKDAGAAAKDAGAAAKDAGAAAKDAGGLGKGALRAARGVRGAGKSAVTDLEATAKSAAKDLKPPFGMAAFKQGLKELFGGFMKAAKVTGVISAAFSIVKNGYEVFTGQEGMPEAMGNIVADSADGFVAGGLTAVASGGILALVGGLFGITAGLPFFLIGLSVSIGCYALFDSLFKATFYDPIQGAVTNFLGG